MGISVFSLIRSIFGKNDLIAGVFFVLFSYGGFLFPLSSINKVSSLIFGASYYLGVLLLGNYITVKLGGFSIISRILGSTKEKDNFIKVTIICGLLFSLVAADLGGFWYFPYWSTFDYILIGFVLGGWPFYILSMIVCYEAVKVILDKVLPEKKIVTRYYKNEEKIYKILLIIGVLSAVIVVAAAFYNTRLFTNFIFSISSQKSPYLEWYYWIVAFVGFLGITEYIEYRKRRSSLLKDAIHGYFTPILSIVLAGIVLSVSNEVQNLAVFLWRYTNYPLPNITLFQIPIFVIATWPLSIFLFIVFWRTFGTNVSKVVFENDEFTIHKETAVAELPNIRK